MHREIVAPHVVQVVRSAAVGTFVTLVDLTLLVALVSGCGISARVVSPVLLVFGIVLQFLGNKLFAFQNPSRAWGRQAVAFLGVEALGFVGNAIAYDLAVRVLPLPYFVTRLCTTSLVYFTICLPLWTRIFQANGSVKEAA